MPHVEIKCYPGRTGEQKQKCADQIALVVVDADACRAAFRLYYESGEVRDLDTFSPVE